MHALGLGLGDKHSIERVAVVERKCGKLDNMFLSDLKHRKICLMDRLEECRQARPQRKFT